MFKVGDKVRVLIDNPRGSAFRKGDEFNITDIQKFENHYFIYGFVPTVNNINYVMGCDIELALPKLVMSHMPDWF